MELILIHPFREGNGRIARLLADLMAMQADKKPLNFSPIESIMNRDLNAILPLFMKVLDKTMRP